MRQHEKEQLLADLKKSQDKLAKISKKTEEIKNRPRPSK